MKGAREIYREIKKATKYREEIEDIQKIENMQERKKALKKIDREINTNDTNTNEYRKIDEYVKATYISLGLKGKVVNEIEDDSVYNKLKTDLIELCKNVSYDKFYLWMINDWKDYFDIKENDDIEMSKKIKYYMELKSIIMSVIDATEDEKNIRKARRIYRNSLNIFKAILKEIADINLNKLINDNIENNIIEAEVYKIDDEANNLLKKYRYYIENIDRFDKNNYLIKSKGDDIIKIKRIEFFFKLNRYIISDEIYNEYKKLKKQFWDKSEITKEEKKKEKYKLYEMIITADKPNLENYFGDELDLLQRCRKEYNMNSDIDVQECIIRNQKVIEEEQSQLWNDKRCEYEW